MDLDQIFGSGPGLSWSQECARAVLIFFFGLALLRLIGRRVFGKWSALDIVVSVIIGSNLSRALTGNAPLWKTLGATILLMILHRILSLAAARWRAVSRLVEGSPVRLGRDGTIERGLLQRHAISDADLHEALRTEGVDDPEKTRLIVLEPSGRITLIKR